MNMQVHHVIVHTPEQVREIVEEARKIADEAWDNGQEWCAVFSQACTLLGARHSVALMPQASPLDLGALGLNGRRSG